VPELAAFARAQSHPPAEKCGAEAVHMTGEDAGWGEQDSGADEDVGDFSAVVEEVGEVGHGIGQVGFCIFPVEAFSSLPGGLGRRGTCARTRLRVSKSVDAAAT
jgi:hypothetical protein